MGDKIDKKEEDTKENLYSFSKNSIINASRKAGVKCISQDGVDKVNQVLNDKIKEMTDKLSIFCNSKNGRTITKKLILQFLESEGVHYTNIIDKE